MSPFVIGIIGFGVLLLFFIIGVPISFSMALVGMVGFIYLVSPNAGLSFLVRDVFSQLTSYPLTVIPMFVLMGTYAFAAGIGRKLFNTTYVIMGETRGGLAIASIWASAGFGAVCGSTTATCATIGRVAIPEMRRFNYSDVLSTGTVAAAGGLGIMIPPSTTFIVYGLLTEQSIGKLFIAGIIPGIIIAIMFMFTVYIYCRRNPQAGPPGPRSTWRQKFASLVGLTDTLLLFALTMGGLFGGIFSPTQAGAIGGAGALLIGIARRELTWKGFVESSKEGLRISCMILLLIAGATVFGHFIAVTQIPASLAGWAGSLPVPPWVIITMLYVFWFILGCFVDAMALIVLLVPIFYPLVISLGFDPIWFGVIITVFSMIAVVTPPVGVNAYVVKGLFKEIPLETVFKGILPYLIPFTIATALIIAFPQLATFLPRFISY
jgi:C4-dicarboxylate transporter DctM subunit